MTRKDFELIAAALKKAWDHTDATDFSVEALSHHRTAVEHTADALAATNPRFDRARFLAAAGVL